MSFVFHSAFRLPTITGFIDNAVSHLWDGVSGLFLFPETAPIEEFLHELRSQFILRRINFLEIDLARERPGVAPVTCFCRELGIQWREPLSPRLLDRLPELCTLPDLMPDVIWLTGLGAIRSEKMAEWIEAARIWAENGKILRDRGIRLPSICIALPATKCAQVPKGDILFKIFYWWGIPSVLEMRLLCVEDSGFGMGFDKWREYIVPNLCAGDLCLLPFFRSAKTLDEKELGGSLMEIARERGWSKARLSSMGIDILLSPDRSRLSNGDSKPAAHILSLWAQGIVNWSIGSGLSISSPALHVIGRHADIRHRLWCGQSDLVLPLINTLRLTICECMSRKYGWNWPVECGEPPEPRDAEAVRESPLNCQLGHLEYVLNRWPSRQKALRTIATYVREARLLRNDLAHNRVISYADFQRLCENLDASVALLAKEF